MLLSTGTKLKRKATVRSPSGVHILKLRWFRVVSIDVFQDTVVAELELRGLAEAGIEEALADPITG